MILTWSTLIIWSWSDEFVGTLVAHILLSCVERWNDARSLTLDHFIHMRTRRVDGGSIYVPFIDKGFRENRRKSKDSAG